MIELYKLQEKQNESYRCVHFTAEATALRKSKLDWEVVKLIHLVLRKGKRARTLHR